MLLSVVSLARVVIIRSWAAAKILAWGFHSWGTRGQGLVHFYALHAAMLLDQYSRTQIQGLVSSEQQERQGDE